MKKVALGLISFYRWIKTLSLPIYRNIFLTDSVCRFRPTCSEYCYQAIEKYGIIRGCWLGIKRVVRCNPWNKGGDDPLL